ncbi:cytochrome P450 [Mycobacterium hubeiense]|uniref:cytochrome P450 n=1 Tax=Mycobacterium hubeiense TaxID=1867256 RepID=UPI0018EB971D|nr:cytochrome P450 [Mycobacterium sp. QGD 101]
MRQGDMMFAARRDHGDVFGFKSLVDDQPIVVTCHPHHVKSLFTADPAIAPSTAGDSPLRPIVGDSSVLTAVGERHRRQRKLLMPSFHGAAIERYRGQIAAVSDRAISAWTAGSTFRMASAAQWITLDVIMSGIFGIAVPPEPGTPEERLRSVVRWLLRGSSSRLAKPAELLNIGRDEPVGPQRIALERLDRAVYPLIQDRRRDTGRGNRNDVLSLLLDAQTDDGETLTDLELRNELLTLVLAGHETTANSIAWACERLLRTPAVYDRLRASVRAGEDDYLEATIHEAMRARPVVPMTGRQVQVPWQLGDYVAPAGTRVRVSILLVHHREDLYPDPFAFRPERFLGVKPSAHTWLPFGGGIRRCLGAALAMEEMRIVLRDIVRRTDLRAPDVAPERPLHRNVTMIPARGGRVTVEATHP